MVSVSEVVSVDRRTGSIDVEPILRERLHMHTRIEELASADFCFEGNTNQGLGMIGVERKRVKDLLGSMRSGRLVGEQLPKMFEHYDFSYLIVEGVTRANPVSGTLEECVSNGKSNVWWRPVLLGNSRFQWQDLNHFLSTLEHSRLIIRQSDDPYQTACHIKSLYSWYRNKEWSGHKSLKQLYTCPMPTITLEDKEAIVRRVAKEFAGIGVEKSLSVATRFRTVWDMARAGTAEWMSIPGIGEGIARKVFAEIRGLNEDRNGEE